MYDIYVRWEVKLVEITEKCTDYLYGRGKSKGTSIRNCMVDIHYKVDNIKLLSWIKQYSPNYHLLANKLKIEDILDQEIIDNISFTKTLVPIRIVDIFIDTDEIVNEVLSSDIAEDIADGDNNQLKIYLDNVQIINETICSCLNDIFPEDIINVILIYML